MRHFYRMVDGAPMAVLMSAVMKRQDLLVPASDDPKISRAVLREIYTDKAVMALPPVKKLALGILQMVDGSLLGSMWLDRLDPAGRSAPPESINGFSNYSVVL